MKTIEWKVAAGVEGYRRMSTPKPKLIITPILGAILFFWMSFLPAAPVAQSQSSTQATPQATYSSPEEALQALVTAATGKDRAGLASVFGPEHEQLMSGDEVEDTNELNDFAEAVSESTQLQKVSDGEYTVIVGKNNFPLPIPIVQKDGKWFFDTKAGLNEILNRRIGNDELYAINTCRAYAIAQWEYFTEGDWDNDGVAEYAQRFISTSGRHDGLYWETANDEKPSPLGQLVAEARAEGYGPKPRSSSAPAQSASPVSESNSSAHTPAYPRHPHHGYYFKILKAQGPHAPGGKYNYVINGNMIAGYALIAYPDKWGNSGVMTFVINQQGRVYQKNLGPETAKIAASINEYDPDPSWKLVEAQP